LHLPNSIFPRIAAGRSHTGPQLLGSLLFSLVLNTVHHLEICKVFQLHSLLDFCPLDAAGSYQLDDVVVPNFSLHWSDVGLNMLCPISAEIESIFFLMGRGQKKSFQEC
jgi:hypothetical protein